MLSTKPYIVNRSIEYQFYYISLTCALNLRLQIICVLIYKAKKGAWLSSKILKLCRQ